MHASLEGLSTKARRRECFTRRAVARTFTGIDRVGLGSRLTSKEIATQNPGPTLWSEFFQLKGELLLALSADNTAEAESWLKRAVHTAAEVEAPMLQLRAALRLGRLWREQGKTEPARQLLSDGYERFTEGFSTADLREAKALLDDLAVVD